MNNKFRVYSQTRATRQIAGDVHNELLLKKGWSDAETIQWARVEEKLNEVEIMLEGMNLKEDEPHA